MLKKLKRVFIGDAINPMDRNVFHQLSLVAFLAWVGLGADGLSSSSYGPEEAFRALGSGHGHLSLYLAIATAITVFIISISYNQIIELFPSGGGGYVVASKLLGPGAGVVAGSALLIDYVLTIAISIASGVDAVFSFLPMAWQNYKLFTEAFFILMLLWLNMRGLKESIQVLLPIFFVFLITHVVLLFWGVFSHGAELPTLVTGAVSETHGLVSEVGIFGFLGILITAYSMGGGTYTGIEAVANGMNTLREPKVRTGKRTMLYMAVSLAITAGGILVCYMLWNVKHVEGQTLNAVLINGVFGAWNVWGIPVGKGIVYVTLLSEALLLFIAAQAGFIAGPTVLSNMAVDSYMPHRFANLSSRLVRLNGLLSMGVGALAILWLTRGKVSYLVVLYSINVFITFSLSQLSMIKHWWGVRKTQRDWWWRYAINGVGLVLTSLILVATTVIKFGQGGWVTMVITGGVIAMALLVNKHYQNVKGALKRLDDMLVNLPFPETPPVVVPPSPEGPTAVVLVNGYSGLGIHTIFSMRKLFKQQDFKNVLFISVGRVDSSKFKGVEEIDNLKHATEESLKRYVSLARSMGYASEYRYTLGIDVIAEIEKMCDDISADYVEPIFFAGKLIFAQENLLTKWLHNQTALELQRRLLFKGHNMVVVPIRVL